jgi:ER lumen protein retaining receptor
MNYNKFKKLLVDPQKLSKIPELKYWLFVTCAIIGVFLLFSSGDFSFLLTLSSILQSLSLLGIVVQARESTQDLSVNTFVIYSAIYLSRLFSILFYESYLPNDSTGDWLYQVVEIMSLVQSVWISYKLRSIKEDTTILYAIPVFMILSLAIHPNLNRNFFTDSMWMLSMVLDSIAVIPLLWKVKASRDLERFSSHFIAAHTVSKILSFLFWIQTYTELNKPYLKAARLATISGYIILVLQLVSLGFTGDFLLHYMKSAVLGTPLILPL